MVVSPQHSQYVGCPVELDWSPMPLKEWRALLSSAPRTTLLQSWPYARAMRQHNQVITRPALIRHRRDILGLFQIQEVALGPLHIVHLHRGPVWLQDNPPLNHWASFLERFTGHFPSRLGRLRRLMPGMHHDAESQALMSDFGFKPKGSPYETIWLDLTRDLTTLRAGLNPKWRNALSKAERSKVRVHLTTDGRGRDWFLRGYARDRQTRGYRSVSVPFLKTLITEAGRQDEAWILRATLEGRAVAGILVLLHGSSATYQAGWTTSDGRTVNAHHLLLWSAIDALKERSIRSLDLGGVHPRMAEGVTRFKKGLGGDHCVLAGLYA
ncbi:MAG: lipid II:glycine glycyltransferase FemX [Alphaproteobacteria bacterium]